MIFVVVIVGGAIFASVQDSEYEVTVDGYLTHDGDRAELGYVEVHQVGPDPVRCSNELDAATSSRGIQDREKGDISFEFEARNSTEFEFCSATDGGYNELIASRSTRIPHLVEETISNEYPTEGYDIVVEDVTVEPVSEVD